MGNVIAVIILALLVGGAVFYLIRAKKRGVKCVGCPACGGCCSCGTKTSLFIMRMEICNWGRSIITCPQSTENSENPLTFRLTGFVVVIAI